MATHRQLPNNTDIAPFQEKGRWYRAFIEKDESGNSKLTFADSGLPQITPTGYGFTMDGQKSGKDFHLISVSCNPDVGTGTAGDPAFFYPTIGQTYTADGSQYVVDFNRPETNVSLKINDTDATVTEQVNGLVQKNIDITATVETVESGESGSAPGMYFLYNYSASTTDLLTTLTTLGLVDYSSYGVTAGTYYVTEIDIYIEDQSRVISFYPNNATNFGDNTYIFVACDARGSSGWMYSDVYTLSISSALNALVLNGITLHRTSYSLSNPSTYTVVDVTTSASGYKIYYTKLVNNDEL